MKIDFYIQIHKAIRRCLFNLSIKIASCDYTSKEICERNHDDLLQVTKLLRSHAKHEEKFFHPLIANKLKKADQLDNEHQQQELELKELEKLSYEIINFSNKIELSQQSLIFYKRLNQFIADYLQHMDQEEQLMPMLQDVSTEQELLEVLQALFVSFSQQEIFDSITYMLPALNPQERLDMMRALLSSADKNAYTKLLMLAEISLPDLEWKDLKIRLEI